MNAFLSLQELCKCFISCESGAMWPLPQSIIFCLTFCLFCRLYHVLFTQSLLLLFSFSSNLDDNLFMNFLKETPEISVQSFTLTAVKWFLTEKCYVIGSHKSGITEKNTSWLKAQQRESKKNVQKCSFKQQDNTPISAKVRSMAVLVKTTSSSIAHCNSHIQDHCLVPISST